MPVFFSPIFPHTNRNMNSNFHHTACQNGSKNLSINKNIFQQYSKQYISLPPPFLSFFSQFHNSHCQIYIFPKLHSNAYQFHKFFNLSTRFTFSTHKWHFQFFLPNNFHTKNYFDSFLVRSGSLVTIWPH